ncbi:MAG: hypothetical protein ACK5V3_05345 [Bdellovibrionales bacterium]
MRSIILFSLFISLYSNATSEIINKEFKFTHADNCKEKRLDLPPGVMSRIPIQDQNTSNFCWSYAGTQMIDAWRAKYRPPTPPWTSPTAHAFRYLSEKGITDPNRNLSGVNFLDRAVRYPSCSQSVVHDRISGQNHRVFFNKMQELHKMARSGEATEATLENKLQACLSQAGINNKIRWNQISQYVQSTEWTGFANQVIGEICKDHTRNAENIPRPEVIAAYHKKFANGLEGMQAIQKMIREKLDGEDPLPVGIRFCPEALKQFLPATLQMDGELNESRCKSKTGVLKNQHFAVIVGRRPVMVKTSDGREKLICQYLIRDSYGTDCAEYPDSTVFTPKDRCVKGQVWVDEKHLLVNTNEAYAIPDRAN